MCQIWVFQNMTCGGKDTVTVHDLYVQEIGGMTRGLAWMRKWVYVSTKESWWQIQVNKARFFVKVKKKTTNIIYLPTYKIVREVHGAGSTIVTDIVLTVGRVLTMDTSETWRASEKEWNAILLWHFSV